MDGQGVKQIADLGASSAALGGKVAEVNGIWYTTAGLHRVPADLPYRVPLELGTLSGLCDFVKADPDGLFSASATGTQSIIRISSPTEVSLVGVARLDESHTRERYAHAMYELATFAFGSWMDREAFNIALQSLFRMDGNAAALLELVGNIVDTNAVEVVDDGVRQSVTRKSTVSGAVLEKGRPATHVLLAPFRSFAEIEPVVSSFVFRMRGGGGNGAVQVALFEADGGRWKLETIDRIAAEISKRLSDEIGAKKTIVVR